MLQSPSRGGGGFSLVLGGGGRGSAWSGGGSLWSGGVLLGLGGGVLFGPGGGSPETPPVDRITDTCKNITLATTSLRPVKRRAYSVIDSNDFVSRLLTSSPTNHPSPPLFSLRMDSI